MDALAEISAWLKRTGLGWYLFGGQAALLRGSTRVTADIDVTVVGSLEVLDRLLGSLPEAFARRADRAFTERTFVLPLLHQPSGVPVDLVIGWTFGPRRSQEAAAEAALAQPKGVWGGGQGPELIDGDRDEVGLGFVKVLGEVGLEVLTSLRGPEPAHQVRLEG